MYISQRAIKESFGQAFSKACRFSGRRPEAHSAECETSQSFEKRRRGWISLQSKGRGRTLVGGSPLFVVSLSAESLQHQPSFYRFFFWHKRRKRKSFAKRKTLFFFVAFWKKLRKNFPSGFVRTLCVDCLIGCRLSRLSANIVRWLPVGKHPQLDRQIFCSILPVPFLKAFQKKPQN